MALFTFDFADQMRGPWDTASGFLVSQFQQTLAQVAPLAPLTQIALDTDGTLPKSGLLTTDANGAPSVGSLLPMGVRIGGSPALGTMAGSASTPAALGLQGVVSFPSTTLTQQTAYLLAAVTTASSAFQQTTLELACYCGGSASPTSLIGVLSTVSVETTGTITQATGIFSEVVGHSTGSGGGTNLVCYEAYPTGPSAGTFTNGYGLHVNTFGANITNKFSLFSGDSAAALSHAGDIYTAAFQDYSATSTVTGWASFTTKVIAYKKVGKTVRVAFIINGTSNSTAVSFTLPYAASGLLASWTGPLGYGYDNTTLLTTQPQWYLTGSTVNAYPSLALGNWTNVNTKIVQGQFWYETA